MTFEGDTSLIARSYIRCQDLAGRERNEIAYSTPHFTSPLAELLWKPEEDCEM
jgi:hypothetical protein